MHMGASLSHSASSIDTHNTHTQHEESIYCKKKKIRIKIDILTRTEHGQ